LKHTLHVTPILNLRLVCAQAVENEYLLLILFHSINKETDKMKTEKLDWNAPPHPQIT